jgi:PPE-repeat protein
MDFAALPPEINSARMYAGPGPASLLAAAVSWDGLAAELYSTATSYRSVIAQLTGGPWLGPASQSMTAATLPYIAWLIGTAERAEEAGGQARASAAAFEAAFAMTVPPPVIAANRSLLATLVATNFLGQNTAAIAATDAHYAEMWAQDATAMYGYAAASAKAVELNPFTPPPPVTSGAGLPAQAAAVAGAAGSPAGHAGTIVSAVRQGLSVVPQALQGLTAPGSSSPLDLLAALGPYVGALDSVIGVVGAGTGVGAGAVGVLDIFAGATSPLSGLSLAGSNGPAPVSPGSAGSGAAVLVSQPQPTPGVSAGMGGSNRLGALSVPQGWTSTAPAPSAPAALPAVSLNAESIPTAMPQGMWNAFPMGQPAGRSSGGAGVRFQPVNATQRAAYPEA